MLLVQDWLQLQTCEKEPNILSVKNVQVLWHPFKPYMFDTLLNPVSIWMSDIPNIHENFAEDSFWPASLTQSLCLLCTSLHKPRNQGINSTHSNSRIPPLFSSSNLLWYLVITLHFLQIQHFVHVVFVVLSAQFFHPIRNQRGWHLVLSHQVIVFLWKVVFFDDFHVTAVPYFSAKSFSLAYIKVSMNFRWRDMHLVKENKL